MAIIGVGVDVVDIDRFIEAALAERIHADAKA